MISTQYRWDIADTIFIPFTPPIILSPPLSFMALTVIDPNKGSILSQTSYESPSLTNTNVNNEFVPEVKSISELPNGMVSILVDMYYPVDDSVLYYYRKVFTRRIVNFIVNDDGYLNDFIAYYPQVSTAPIDNSSTLESVWQPPNGNGEQILLAKDPSNQLVLFAIDAAGKIEWTKSYKNPLPTNNAQGFMIEKQNGKGYFIFQSDPDQSNFHLLITNAIGNDSCVQLPPPKMIAEHTVWPWPFKKVRFQSPVPNVDFRLSRFKMLVKDHSVTQNVSCYYQYQCCKDVIDSLHAHNISICENENYTLPDNTRLNKSGTYYLTLKTTRGCDSVVLYHLKVLKSPAHLVASPDTCLEHSFSVQLSATGGYDGYTWNESYTTTDSTYSVHLPGNYSVSVANMCGSKTDSINVYDHCDFPIYFPSAFTPNGDHLNDELRVPPENRNKLIQLKVYNRWGQLVFSTNIIGKGWDGNLNGAPQPSGVYTYYLEMQGLSGHPLNQKGTVVLIR
jgi:gliding motility-associated-like protein